MRHRKFVVATTAMMLAFAGVVVGLAFYSNHAATASVPSVPQVIRFLPADSQAVFGMNVQKFVDSPVYKRFEAKQGEKVGQDLQEFIAKTGVDPKKDIHYIVGAGKSEGQRKGAGVVFAVGNFNTAAITTFINSKGAPIEVPYKKGKVLMIPEADGNKLEKGVAYLSESEIALGDLESLKQVLDIQAGDALGIDTTKLGQLLLSVNPEEMFWFAGDATSILSKAPANTPLGGNLSTIQTVFGTLDLTDVVKGKITATTKDAESATQLAKVVEGFVALGNFAASNAQNPELAVLMAQVKILVKADGTTINLTVDFPTALLDQLEQLKGLRKKVV